MKAAIWNNVKTSIKDQVPGHSYSMWIEPLEVIECCNEKIVLSCPNSFSKRRIESNYAPLIASEINKLTGNKLSLIFDVSKKNSNVKKVLNKQEETVYDTIPQLNLPNVNIWPKTGRMLRKNYTFERFVVGSNSDYAFSAAVSLASNKRSSQNSLYLLSKTGMGKTHLSQAMGHRILSKYPSDRVCYTTAEDFLNEMIYSFKNKTIEKFKKKYRTQCDVLLLEDIHFLTGKDYTQVELGQILDYMFDADKKIIFTSCYLPADIPKINDQLRSRLSSSLISSIDSPDFKTRVKILWQKSKENSYSFPSNIIDYLAEELSDDVRQLESGLAGVATKSSLLGAPIDLDLAQSVVKTIATKRKTITIDVIKKLVCKEYGIQTKEIVLPTRKRSIARPRQVAIYLSKIYTDQSLKTIGKSFNRIHATVLHSVGVVERAIQENSAFKKQVNFIREKLDSGKF
jgi:chromosomal replication initiator protein